MTAIPHTVTTPSPRERLPHTVEKLSTVLGEAAGAVSTCWSDLDAAGVFDSTRAAAIVDELLETVLTITQLGEPALGCASTLELIEELKARAEVSATVGDAWPHYRTVDSE